MYKQLCPEVAKSMPRPHPFSLSRQEERCQIVSDNLLKFISKLSARTRTYISDVYKKWEFRSKFLNFGRNPKQQNPLYRLNETANRKNHHTKF